MRRLALLIGLAMLVLPGVAQASVKVPVVHGKPLAQVERTLRKDHIRYTVQDSTTAPVKVNRVSAIKPKAGRLIKRNGKVTLIVRIARSMQNPGPPPPVEYTAPGVTGPVTQPTVTGVGDVPGCLQGADPTSFLQQYPGSSVMRVVISPFFGAQGNNGEAIPCMQAAIRDGFKIMLTIQWANAWNAAQTVAYFQQELSYYGQYAWAIGIGNEQELANDSSGPTTGDQYAAMWDAVEPVVAQLAPQATRVAGEISGWGGGFLQQAIADGLPGAQAISAHIYMGGIDYFLGIANAAHLPLWVTEGMSGPDAWGWQNNTLTLSQLSGAQMGLAWLNDSSN